MREQTTRHSGDKRNTLEMVPTKVSLNISFQSDLHVIRKSLSLPAVWCYFLHLWQHLLNFLSSVSRVIKSIFCTQLHRSSSLNMWGHKKIPFRSFWSQLNRCCHHTENYDTWLLNIIVKYSVKGTVNCGPASNQYLPMLFDQQDQFCGCQQMGHVSVKHEQQPKKSTDKAVERNATSVHNDSEISWRNWFHKKVWTHQWPERNLQLISSIARCTDRDFFCQTGNMLPVQLLQFQSQYDIQHRFLQNVISKHLRRKRISIPNSKLSPCMNPLSGQHSRSGLSSSELRPTVPSAKMHVTHPV